MDSSSDIKAAIKEAVKALDERSRRYIAGAQLYAQGHRAYWIEQDAKKYKAIVNAIDVLERAYIQERLGV